MKKLLSLCIIISLTISSGCAIKAEGQEGKNQTKSYVKVEEVTIRNFRDVLSIPGILKPREEVMISANVSGTVEKINVDIGSRVNLNDTLCIIDDLTYRMQYDKALTALNIEKIDFAESQKDFDRKKALFEAQAISRVEYEGAENKLKIGEENLKRIQSDFNLAQKSLSDTIIKAPISGTVSLKDISRGETASPGKPIFGVVNTETMFVETGISEEYITRVKEDQTVQFKVDAYKERLFQGIIKNIGPVPDKQTKTYPIKILAENTDGLLKTGMFAALDIITDFRTGSLAVPKEAVLSISGKKYVFIVKDGIAIKKNVTLGYSDEDFFEVSEGLNQGEQVIVKGHNKLKDGDLIEIK